MSARQDNASRVHSVLQARQFKGAVVQIRRLEILTLFDSNVQKAKNKYVEAPQRKSAKQKRFILATRRKHKERLHCHKPFSS
eukprot:6199325-Pleurochrysis_carterae.AAC.1